MVRKQMGLIGSELKKSQWLLLHHLEAELVEGSTTEEESPELVEVQDEVPNLKYQKQSSSGRKLQKYQKPSPDFLKEIAASAVGGKLLEEAEEPFQTRLSLSKKPPGKYDRSLKKTRTGFGARLNAFFANFRSVGMKHSLKNWKNSDHEDVSSSGL